MKKHFLKQWSVPMLLAVGLAISVVVKLNRHGGESEVRSKSGAIGGGETVKKTEDIKYIQFSPIKQGTSGIEDDTTIFCQVAFLDSQSKLVKSNDMAGSARVFPPVIRDMAKKVGVGGTGFAIVPHSVYFNNRAPEVELPDGEDVRISLKVIDAIPAGMTLEPNSKNVGLLVADMDKSGVAETLKGGDWAKLPQSYKWIDKNYARPLKMSGVTENREWVGPQTGLFMVGRKIGEVSVEDLVGTYTGGMDWESGYDVLGQFDSDNSGRLEGWEMDEIFVWIDGNSDAIVQDNEINKARDTFDSIVLMPSEVTGAKSRSKDGVNFKDRSVGGTWEWTSRANR